MLNSNEYHEQFSLILREVYRKEITSEQKDAKLETIKVQYRDYLDFTFGAELNTAQLDLAYHFAENNYCGEDGMTLEDRFSEVCDLMRAARAAQ
jgi:hypothetical protein